MIVVRLQTVVSREVAPGDTAVLTVGSIQAGTKSNVIPDHAVLQLNVRTYSEQTRTTVLAAIERIVRAECEASGSPKDPEFELFDRYPLTDNDAVTTGESPTRSTAFFGDRRGELPQQSASEDFSDIPERARCARTPTGVSAVSTPTPTGRPSRRAGSPRTSRSTTPPTFAPVIQPTLDTGTQALVAAALEWLTRT